jgi:hypothetical protein
MVRPHQPTPKEKCKYCRLGWSCPIHGGEEEAEERRTFAARVRSTKEAKRAVKGRSKKDPR